MKSWIEDYAWPILVMAMVVLLTSIIIYCAIKQGNVVNTTESYELLVTWQEDGVQREAHIRLVPIPKKAE